MQISIARTTVTTAALSTMVTPQFGDMGKAVFGMSNKASWPSVGSSIPTKKPHS
jgi:hypothetical protein